MRLCGNGPLEDNMGVRTKQVMSRIAVLAADPSDEGKKELGRLLDELDREHARMEDCIREMRGALETFERNRLEYADIFERAPVGYAQVDLTGKVQSLNPMACRLLDLPRWKLSDKGMGVAELLDERSRSDWERLLTCALEKEQPVEEMLRTAERGGTGRWLHAQASVAKKEGRPSHLLLCMQDVTARKAAADALKRQSALQGLLMRISSEYINLPMDGIDGGIRSALGEIGRFIGADRATLLAVDREGRQSRATHEWRESESAAAGFGGDSFEMEPCFLEKLLKGETFYASDAASFPSDSRVRLALGGRGVRGMLQVPLIDGGVCRGGVVFEFQRASRSVTEPERKVVELFAKALVGIQSRRDADKALREQESKLRLLFESMRDLVFVVDADGRYVEVAPCAGHLLYRPESEIIGRTMREVMPPELAENFMEALGDVLRDGVCRFVDYELELGGKRRWFSARISPCGDNRTLWVARDVSDRAEAEEALRESETRFRKIAELLPEVVFEIDLTGRVLFANKRAMANFGCTAEDLSNGVMAFDMLVPEDRERAKANFAKRLGGTPLSPQEYTALRINGTRFPVFYDAAPLTRSGQIVGFLGAMMDISERKRAEERLRETNRNLEEATARASAMAAAAEMASLAKSEFLAKMSHEIRTPMNAILGMAELMWEGELEPRQRERLATIQSTGAHLLEIVNEILDYSKIEAGGIRLEERPFDLRDFVGQCLDMLRGKAAEKGLSLAGTVEESVPGAILGDPMRLRQVAINLLGNAVKFTERGEVRLDAGILSDGRLAIAVRDTGVGIEARKLPTLFARYVQVDGPAGRRKDGTGLGLAISKEIVQAMGGEIRVESEPGKGSVFTVVLPTRKAEGPGHRPSGETKSATMESAAKPGIRLASMSVLLVDDVEVNRDLVKAYLEGQPVEVVEAENGIEAVARCDERRFDVVLMDIEMPEMDGLEAIRRIRETERARGCAIVPIVALTAHAMKQQAEEYRMAGATAVLPKPIRKRDLVGALQACAGAGVPVDVGRLVEEYGGKRDRALTSLEKYAGQLRLDVEAIQRALEGGDCESVRKFAHKHKGASANLAADRLAEAAAQLEKAAQGGERAACAAGMACFREEAERFAVFMKERLAAGWQGTEPNTPDALGSQCK